MLTRVVAGAGGLKQRFDELRLGVKLRYGWLDPVEIHAYRGHGTPEVLYLKGRVLEEREVGGAVTDTGLRNLRVMARRFRSDEIQRARVRARCAGVEQEVVTDGEGFFDLRIVPSAPLERDQVWHDVELELLGPKARGQGPVGATGQVLVPPPDAAFGVISDIDDTIVRTSAFNTLTMLRIVFLSNAYTRLPFEGVAAFYQALQEGDSGAGFNPIFYVSSSPWNLYDLLVEFLDVHEIPTGPLFLKDLGFAGTGFQLGGHQAHKRRQIELLLATYDTLPFILIGDSGQEDPEIYRQVVRDYPGRILGIYIRNVTAESRRRAVEAVAAEVGALGVPMLLVEDTVAAASHAAERGFINPASLPLIRANRAEDARGPVA